MSERACGIHALDAAPNDACPHCTRARIQARDEEIERLRQEVVAARATADEAAKTGFKYLQLYESATAGWALANEQLAEVRAECERLATDHQAEVDEFNAGYHCAMNGGAIADEPSECPYDVWQCGFAWGVFLRRGEA